MDDKFYTVEQISQLLKIHAKTIQRYIREGKLRASKVGKSWRVSGHDLSAFIENSGMQNESEETMRTSRVSTVIDIPASCTDEAIRTMNYLTAAPKSKSPESMDTSVHVQYIEQERIVRVMLWGDIHFTVGMLEMIAAATESRQ